MWEIGANLLLPKALKSCLKYTKSPNLVTLVRVYRGHCKYYLQEPSMPQNASNVSQR